MTTTQPMGEVGEHPDAELCSGGRQAVAESQQLLDEYWSAWCADHDVDPVPRPRTQTPVVSQVGLDPDALEWVALIRFDVCVASERLHGLVRGPVDDAIFEVHRAASAEAPVRRHRLLSRNRRTRW